MHPRRGGCLKKIDLWVFSIKKDQKLTLSATQTNFCIKKDQKLTLSATQTNFCSRIGNDLVPSILLRQPPSEHATLLRGHLSSALCSLLP